MIYAAVPAGASANPNTVIPINAATGAVGTPIPVGTNPVLLAASSDGNYLFVAAQGDQTIQRINVQTNAVDKTFPYPPPTFTQVSSAVAMRAVPGSPQSVVVAFSAPQELALYDNTGLVSSVSIDLSSFAFLDGPGTIYGLDSAGFNYLPVITLDSQGLHYTPDTTVHSGPEATGKDLQSDGSLLYTNTGEIWDPASESLLGTFNLTIDNSAGSLRVDASAARTFLIGDQLYPYAGNPQYDALTLFGYDNTTHQQAGMVPFFSFPIHTTFQS